MNPLIILALMAGVPFALALVLRVSSVFVFASAAAGGLLVEYLSDDVGLSVSTFLKDKDPNTVVHLVLLLLPVALTMFFLRKTLKKSKYLFEFLPLAASVAMLLVLVVPELPPALREQVMGTQYGAILHKSEDVVVGAAVLLNLCLMWLLYKKRNEEGAHGKGHHGKHH